MFARWLVVMLCASIGSSDKNVLNYVRGVMEHNQARDITGVPVFDYVYATGDNIQLGYRNESGIYRITSSRHALQHDLVCGLKGRNCSKYDFIST
jgi:hypothetical protein